MGTPTTGAITFTDVASTQLGQSTPYSMSGMYNTANTGGYSGLMYHNLNMAPGNATTAKTAIWDNYNAGTNYALTNWYNYSQSIGIVVTYTINNYSSYAVTVNLTIWNSSSANVGSIYSGSISAGSPGTPTTVGPTTVDTGALTSVSSSGYYIAVQGFNFSNPISPPNPPPLINRNASISASSASDTDGVGAGTSRTALGTLGNIADTNQQFPPPPPPTNFTATIAVNSGGSVININKRTTFVIDIT
jgi:hypothetical protein